MTEITTTLNAIRQHSLGEDGWEKLLKHLGKTKADDEPLKFSTILESNGLDYALWFLRVLPEEHHGKIRHLAADCAERVLHIFEIEYPEDKRPREAIQAARDFADGKITKDEMAAAASAAAAAYASASAAAAAYAYAAYAAYAAAAAYAAYAAAAYAAYAASTAYAAERKAQAELLIKYFG